MGDFHTTNNPLAMDIEIVLGLLKAKKIQVGMVAEKVGLTRTQLSTIRESTNEGKKSEWAEKIVQAYPEVFPDGEVPTEGEEGSTLRKYIRLLERNLEKAEDENARLREQNEAAWKKILGN